MLLTVTSVSSHKWADITSLPTLNGLGRKNRAILLFFAQDVSF